MTFIEQSDSSPVSQYMQGTLHFIAPFYWQTNGGWSTINTNVPTSWSVLKTLWSENINWIAYSLYRPFIVWFDEYDWLVTDNRNSPIWQAWRNNYFQMNINKKVRIEKAVSNNYSSDKAVATTTDNDNPNEVILKDVASKLITRR